MAASTDRLTLPTTLQWYRDGANWIVGLSTGAIAASIAYYDKFIALDRWAIALLLCGMAAFVVSVLLGILFYFWIVSYGNQLEYRDRLEEELTAAVGDTQKEENLQRKLVANEKKRNSALDVIRGLWTPMLWTFFVGVVALALSAMFYVANPRSPEANWSLSSVSTSLGTTSGQTHSLVLRIDAKSGDSWLLCTPTDQLPFWRRLETRASAPGSSPMPSTIGCAPAPPPKPESLAAVVAFGSGEFDLSPAAVAAIRRTANHAKELPNTSLFITAHTDTTGSFQFNARLARKRAESVRQSLLLEGIPPNRIFVSEAALESLPYPTGRNVREPANRVVVVEVR